MQRRTTRPITGNQDKAFAIMIAVLLIGVLLGTVSYCFLSNDLSQQLIKSAEEHIEFRINSDFGHILLHSFFASSLFMAAVFLLGFFALGQLPILAVLAYRGMGIGMVLSQCYSSHSGKEAFSAALLVIPSAVIACYALCMAAKEAVRFSTRLLAIVLSNDPCTGIAETTKLYGVRFLALEAVCAASAAADCFCSVLFASHL